MLTIAIDYDGTWAADAKLWEMFAEAARARGHQVILITNRTNDFNWGDEVRNAGEKFVDKVLIAGTSSKRIYAKERGWDVDIWIDDNPQWVNEEGLRFLGPRGDE